jgi:uncharacterized SAM-binding protein YcdF (DUF218 family)
MVPPANFPRRKTPYGRLNVALGAALVCFLLAFLMLRNIGRWLVVEDPLGKAQAIAVLSGGLPVRALGAADLYRAGWAPQLWLTRSTQTEEALAELGVTYYGEEVYDQQLLVHQGVPAPAIMVLPTSIVNTADELQAIAAKLPADGSGVVIIVTSKVHTRRVRALWRRLQRGRAIVRAAPEDPFEPGRWWRTSGDALDVVRECLGLLNTWAGLPLRGS